MLTGGEGNDLLLGGSGNDTYVFNPGDGADRIEDAQGVDTIHIGGTLTAADLQTSRNGNDMILTIGSAGDSITIANWFVQTGGARQIEFGNGDIQEISLLADSFANHFIINQY